MYKVKVLGAGSIGNHLSHASRQMGWDVTLCDIDEAALERARSDIYPGRYGAWDAEIELVLASEAPRGGFDLVVIGTPPDAHVPLALEAVAERPRAILVEKPVCGPDLEDAEELRQRAEKNGVSVFVGYDHVVGRGAVTALEAARQLDTIETLDVEFREHWAGIFAAHSWLDGPKDSYLGFWRRGGERAASTRTRSISGNTSPTASEPAPSTRCRQRSTTSRTASSTTTSCAWSTCARNPV